MANKKKQLTAQLNALKERTAGYQSQIASNISAMTAAKTDAETPYVEEFPTGFEAEIPGIVQDAAAGANVSTQELPEGFTPGPYPDEFIKFFGPPPANIMGYKIDQFTDASGKPYYKVSISQKGEYGTAKSGSITFGGALTKDANGNWAVYQAQGNAFGGGLEDGGYGKGLKTKEQLEKEAKDAENKQARQSAYDLLYAQFKQYGLESLVEGIKGLIQENISPSEFSIRLQDTEAYKKRFAANQDRIKQGLRALTPAEYIGLEDQYQNIMRNYGLPPSYWSKDSMGTQSGFNKFIANDVSAAELEDRISTAQKRVINADPAVTDALRQFYPDITNADILAYTLDPTNALENIKRKVTAAEIGGAAMAQGLGTSVGRAEELAKYGVTKAQAQAGYQVIGEFLPTGQKLAEIYEKQELGPYSQLLAEQEVFGTQGAVDAARKRRKLAELEKATFMGTSGVAQGALARDRAGAY